MCKKMRQNAKRKAKLPNSQHVQVGYVVHGPFMAVFLANFIRFGHFSAIFFGHFGNFQPAYKQFFAPSGTMPRHF